MDHPIPPTRPNLVLIIKEKKTCNQEDFPVPVEHRVKIKES